MNSLRDCILSQIEIDQLGMDTILAQFEPRTLKKGDFLLRSGKICREMAFIKSGYLRMYDLADGKEITFWIGSSGRFITSLSSFVFRTPSFWNIQAVTDCELMIISHEQHQKLCDTSRKWLEFDNLLLANSFTLLEKNMFAQLHTTAEERLKNLMNEEPRLFNHVPLQYIAAMIGIAPESLSRLRKKLARSIS